MSVLVGGIPGSSSRLSGGLAGVGPVMVSDVTPMAIAQPPPSIGTRAGKFRRAIIGVTRNNAGNPLAAVTVEVYRTSDDVELDSQVSDANGNYELSVYEEGPFWCEAYLSGATDVAGSTVNTLKGA
jgi:hypothetical protein